MFNIYTDMLAHPHVLIAGATGSGKSVCINAMIYEFLKQEKYSQMVLIDPKRVELYPYHALPCVRAYASEIPEIAQVLNGICAEMDNRYRYTQQKGLREFPGGAIFVFVEEFADLMTLGKKECLLPLCRIAQLGRAARIHLVLAAQRPTRDIIPGQIKVNIDCRLALRCPTAQDSRNIIGCNGAESLPMWGYGYYARPEDRSPIRVEIRKVSDAGLKRIADECRRRGY